MSAQAEKIDPDMPDAKRRLLEQMLSGAAPRKTQVDGVVRRGAADRVPMSLEQQNVWLHSAMAPDRPLYNEPITIHRKGSFDLGLMEKSFNEVLRRHEAWRTSFRIEAGEAVPVVHDDLHVALPLVDLTSLPAIHREAEALRLATEDARKPIDLTSPPLFRAHVFKLADDDHRLHLTLHHIIFDGVSIYRVVVPELSATYNAYASGGTPELAPARLQYGDYAIWRERHASSDAVAKQLNYWRQTLSGSLPILQLPGDRPRPPVPSYRGSMETFALSGPLTEALKSFSRTEGLTLYMTLLAVFKALLHRYSGQDDIIIGGVTDTRRRPELQNVVGYFLNSLALRTQPKSDMRFRDYLAQVRDAVAGALSASDVPFDRIVRDLQPKRDLSAHPLFQILFSVEPPAPTFADGWDLTQMDVTVGAAKFDLYLELDERPEGLIGRFLYSSDLFDRATIRRMIGHWRTLLEGVVADPDCTLAHLPILTPEELRQFAEWNDTCVELPQTTLHGLFEAQTRRTPSAVAVECDGETWTYRDLDRRADAIARRLRDNGVKAGTLVGIFVERSLDMMAGLLGILKAGAAYLPLDPAFPAQRLSLIVDEAKPRVLLTQRSLKDCVPESTARVILCDDVDPFDVGAVPLTANVGAGHLAYIIYTSGSTGKPKGVEIPHGAVVNLFLSMMREPGCGADDRLLAVTTLSFDIAALELFLPLMAGGRVVIAKKDDAFDPARLAELIERSACTIMQATPATWRALLDTAWRGKQGLKIFCGGEALPRELADRLLARSGEVWNMYGPTETTVWSTIQKVEPDGRIVAIGRPIANTRAYILDADDNLVPVGVTGELCIGGEGVARGYHRREDLTRERFVTVAAVPGEWMYRTGDLARYRPDGTIECLGRNDEQVKVRGFRIELEEIEGALAAHPDIAAAALKAWPDASGELALCAYLVKRGEHEPDAAMLRRFLQNTLPDYMVPSRYVLLESLPLTPNAKVDRKALPEPDRIIAVRAFVAPRDVSEEMLAGIWKDVLRVKRVGATDDFFDLGGHSLLLAKLLRRVELAFGIRLSLAAAFQASTLESMARLLADPQSAAKQSRIMKLQTAGSRPPLFWLNDGQVMRGLADAIGKDQPFISVALDAEEESALGPSPQLVDIASRLVETIRAEQPHGSYYLGGWCTSGILAYEVASQMKAKGFDVGLIILLHAANPAYFGMKQKIALETGRLRHGVIKALKVPGADRWQFALERIASNAARLLRERSASPQDVPFSETLDRAATIYVPKPYSGDVVLFQPALRPDALDYRAYWAPVVAGQFAALDIGGNHYTILDDPCVRELGAKMNACLDAAQRRERVPVRSAG